MINLLIFDLDGTLFDTAQGITNAFNKVLQDRGEAPIPRDKIIEYIGTGLKDLIEQLGQEFSDRLGSFEQLEKDFRSHYNDNFLQESQLYEGVIDFLEQWPHQLAIVSNKSEYYVHELVARSPLHKFPWQRIIGGNSLPQKKPHPLPLLEVLKTASAKPESALMIGDGLPDMLAARAANVKSVAVEFGYTPISQLIQAGAHASFSHYKDLAKVVREFQ